MVHVARWMLNAGLWTVAAAVFRGRATIHVLIENMTLPSAKSRSNERQNEIEYAVKST